MLLGMEMCEKLMLIIITSDSVKHVYVPGMILSLSHERELILPFHFREKGTVFVEVNVVCSRLPESIRARIWLQTYLIINLTICSFKVHMMVVGREECSFKGVIWWYWTTIIEKRWWFMKTKRTGYLGWVMVGYLIHRQPIDNWNWLL